MERHSIMIRLKKEIHELLKADAERKGIAVSAIITQLIFENYKLELEGEQN